MNLIWIILDRHTSYNINDLKVPSSVTKIIIYYYYKYILYIYTRWFKYDRE
jgi:hypothetical protein